MPQLSLSCSRVVTVPRQSLIVSWTEALAPLHGAAIAGMQSLQPSYHVQTVWTERR